MVYLIRYNNPLDSLQAQYIPNDVKLGVGVNFANSMGIGAKRPVMQYVGRNDDLQLTLEFSVNANEGTSKLKRIKDWFNEVIDNAIPLIYAHEQEELFGNERYLITSINYEPYATNTQTGARNFRRMRVGLSMREMVYDLSDTF